MTHYTTTKLLALATVALLPLCGFAGPPFGQQAQPAVQPFAANVRPLVLKYCAGCHSGKQPTAGVDLTADSSGAAARAHSALWQRALDRLREDAMPPGAAPQPTPGQRGDMIRALSGLLSSAVKPNPGRVIIHRLNRTEYNNTVRDLLGVTTNPANSFPADGGGGGGFDNDADTLFLPPILMERYLAAAGQIVRQASPQRIFFVRPHKGLSAYGAARQIIAHFAMRAFRRPVAADEMSRLLRLYTLSVARGQSFQGAVRLALKAILISPEFLFRIENENPSGNAHPVDDYSLACRLSYFLWSSMPDEELFRLAAAGKLHRPAILLSQVRRMLKDPKARALADNFAGQWLRVRDLYTSTQPDTNRFPDYTPTLRDAMYQEVILFFNSILQDNGSLLLLIDAPYTYLNEELARHYGVNGVEGPAMRRVLLTDPHRGGVITMAAVLTLTSFPDRTSPVLRGKWVLSEILGAPPPPPPADAGALPPDDSPRNGLTFRQQLEKHRSNPRCASCHSRMDPIGFGLENFDAVGRWRDKIAGQPVDASGVLTTGERFSGPAELKKLLEDQKTQFVRNVTQRMLSYALGRGLESYDEPAVDRICAALARSGYRCDTLIDQIVESYPFRYRLDS